MKNTINNRPPICCHTCGGHILQRAGEAAGNKRSYCSWHCRTGYITSWYGYILQHMAAHTKKEIAEHIGISTSTLETWAACMRRAGLAVAFRPARTAAPRRHAPEKARRLQRAQFDDEPILRINTRPLNAPGYRMVRVDGRTWVQRREE